MGGMEGALKQWWRKMIIGKAGSFGTMCVHIFSKRDFGSGDIAHWLKCLNK